MKCFEVKSMANEKTQVNELYDVTEYPAQMKEPELKAAELGSIGTEI